MKRLSAEWLKSVKAEVIEELKTRRGTGASGSLASYLTTEWKYASIPTDGDVLKEEHYDKIVEPLTAINSNTFPDHQNRTFDLDEYTDKFDQFQPTIISDSDKGGLVQIQYTGNGHGCEAACTGWCSSGCYGVCTATCGTLCEGTASSEDAMPNVWICSADCNTLCGNIATCNGCGNYCSTACGANCSGGCVGGCTGTCKNGCADGCQGGCMTACQGSCKDSCVDSCESAAAFSI